MIKTKKCNKCKKTKGTNHYHKNKGKPDGLQAYCIPCHRAMVDAGKYGVAEAEIFKLREVKQCEACGRTEEEIKGSAKLCIDHCHDGGHVRGVLCQYCNVALGNLLDDPVRILKLGMYLNRVTYDKSNTLSTN